MRSLFFDVLTDKLAAGLSLLGGLLVASVCSADVRLPSIIGDGMVLQREAKVAIWGGAAPSEEVSVTFQGQQFRTRADRNGQWSMSLGRYAAGGPYEMTISGNNTLLIRDILVGDVWLASGQSNMEWPIKGPFASVNDADREIAGANFPQIRLFAAEHKVALHPQADLKASGWRPATTETVGEFSAVGYLFGRDLHARYGVPIGLIQSTWGGTVAEAWMSAAGLERFPEFQQAIRALGHPATREAHSKYEHYVHQKAAWYSQHGFKDRGRDRLADIDATDYTVAYRNGADLRDFPRLDAKTFAARPLPTRPQYSPTVLFNGMIHPLTRFRIKGVIWYQGEENAIDNRSAQYRALFPELIRDWRRHWGYEFPFLFVQLAGFGPNQPEPAEYSWAELREAQRMALSVPATGMATAIDVGDERDGHPKNKQTVAQRLALVAAKVAYGESVVHSGPMYQSMQVQGDQILIRFSEIGSGLSIKDKYGYARGFEIAGSDGKFHWAQARQEGQDILVSNKDVQNPIAVRYSWSNTPDGNVYNKEGLPAVPFRTADPSNLVPKAP